MHCSSVGMHGASTKAPISGEESDFYQLSYFQVSSLCGKTTVSESLAQPELYGGWWGPLSSSQAWSLQATRSSQNFPIVILSLQSFLKQHYLGMCFNEWEVASILKYFPLGIFFSLKMCFTTLWSSWNDWNAEEQANVWLHGVIFRCIFRRVTLF